MHRHLTRLVLGLTGCTVLITTGCGSSGGSTGTPEDTQPTKVGQVVMPTGCGADGAVVLAVAGHANAPAPVVTARMQAAVDTAMTGHAAIGLVSVEGRPALVQAGVFSSDAGNPAAKAEDADGFRASLATAVAKVRATTAHVDDLQALQLSADAVHSACPTGGTVLLEDPGLPDHGALDFAASVLLTASPADLVTFLRQHQALPTLTDITVVLDVGNTAPPQQPLTVSARKNLTAIWQAVVMAAGARAVTIDPSPIGGAAPARVPAVDTVPVSADGVYRVQRTGTTSITLPDSGPVGFVADRAVFRDPAAATAQLVELAGQITGATNARVTLVGTTSSAGGTSASAKAGRVALSRARAVAVERVLVAHGVPASSISVQGVGTAFPQFERDTDRAGDLLPGPAAHNRSVRVTVVAG